ncbi:MAG: hypothetical protein PHY80_03585 [Rickettsiales bacterium]|nr:hypothetical protein [Rickettsiales bacterium]
MSEVETRSTIDVKQRVGHKLPWYIEERNKKSKKQKFLGFFGHFFGSDGDAFDGKKVKSNWQLNRRFRERAGSAIGVAYKHNPTNVGNAGRTAAVFDAIDRGLGAPGKFMKSSDYSIFKILGFVYNATMFAPRLIPYLGKKGSEASARYFIRGRYKRRGGVTSTYEALENGVKKHNQLVMEYNRLSKKLKEIEKRQNYINENVEQKTKKINQENTRLSEYKIKLEEEQQKLSKKISESEEKIIPLSEKWKTVLAQQNAKAKKTPSKSATK